MTLTRAMMVVAVMAGALMFTSARVPGATPAPAGSGGGGPSGVHDKRPLEEATAKYLDAVDAGEDPDPRPLMAKYSSAGTRWPGSEFFAEASRQARTRKSEAVTLHLLDKSMRLLPNPKPLLETAREALDSPSEALRVMAARWCAKHKGTGIPEDMFREAAEIIRRRFAESKGEECWGEMFTIRAREDAPMVREIYEAHYHRFLPPVIDTPLEDYRPVQPLSQEVKDALRAMRMLRLLAELGDRDAAEELKERDPQKVKKLRSEEHWRKRRAEVEERMGHPVSLQADVAAYLDFRLRGDYVIMEPLYKLYGQEVWFKEGIRQAEERKSAYLLSHLLIIGEGFQFDCLRALAVKNLESDSHEMRQSAVWWCAKNADALSPAERDRYAQVVRRWFYASDGQEGYWQMKGGLATPADLPLIRSLYDRRYKTPKPGDPPLYSCAEAFRANGQRTRSDILLLLAQLGDAAPSREIRAAIEQEKDPQQRLWGIFVAVRLKDKSLIPLIAKALDDKRPSEEPIESDSDPEVKNPRAWLTMYTRVCDLAVRAIHELDPPAEPWPFRVPLARIWRVALAYQSFDFRQELGKGWELLDEHTTVEVVNRRVILGFTDDQINYARQHAAGQRE
ncbi:MAG TPA: hypothetical protein VMW52_00090 [Phycisphaerae bacterium]|nr:hypothetical protein [Phycisphaerae bacterium]